MGVYVGVAVLVVVAVLVAVGVQVDVGVAVSVGVGGKSVYLILRYGRTVAPRYSDDQMSNSPPTSVFVCWITTPWLLPGS